VADRRQTRSKYTAERDTPGAFEGETVTRRRFMTGVAHGAGGVAAAAFTLPALGFALAPIFKHEAWSWQVMGPVSDFPPFPGDQQDFVTRVLNVQKDAGESGTTLVYMRKRIPGVDTEHEDQYNQIIAISSRCMHVGCPVRWTPAAERFICPCHGGVYNIRGIVTGGPPVRPLDRFYTRIRNGMVEVGPRYSVNSELQRFSPRLPGEPLDGIGQYLYPAQFAGPKKP
jgi:quinol---cytochrome c reductase iron-sulfur subunit, bacillus type